MPLSAKGKKILASMRETYGKRVESVFYASKNKGTITGVEAGKHFARKKHKKP